MSTLTVLLTRFNVKTASVANPKAISVPWLRERLELFENITLPAIAAQDRRPDKWLVFFDEATPQASRHHIAALLARFPLLEAVFCVTLTPEVYRQAITQRMPPDCDWLITTRIDNDDALPPSTLKTVYETARPGRREFINPLRGLIVAGSRAYRKRDYSSPFISLSESAANFETVWIDQHQRLKRHGPIRQLQARDSWIQVVHGGNLANQIRGLRARHASIDQRSLPPILAAQLRPESLLEWVADNSVNALRRYAGSAVRFTRRVLAG